MSALTFLTTPRARWVDIHVSVSLPASDGTITVQSTHRSYQEQQLQHFSTKWSDPLRIDTEYAHGLSLIHDLKDHYFYGLGLTPLTEFQTIVQTYYGRAVFQGDPPAEAIERIREHVFHELFALEGRPLVYDQAPTTQAGLLAAYAPNATEDERSDAFEHMCTICEDIMLPPLRQAYETNAPLRLLQAPTQMQPELIEHFLKSIEWTDRKKLLLQLGKNAGFETIARAYVDDELHAITCSIGKEASAYVREHDLVRKYGRIFDPTHYALA